MSFSSSVGFFEEVFLFFAWIFVMVYCTPFCAGCKMKISVSMTEEGQRLIWPVPRRGAHPPSARWARHFPRRRGKLLCRYSSKPPPYDGGGGPLAVVGAYCFLYTYRFHRHLVLYHGKMCAYFYFRRDLVWNRFFPY